MAPSSLLLDVWSSSEQNITLDVLMPNGLLLTVDANRDATLMEVKEDVWETAQHHPLYGLLHDMDSYVFVCINQTTAEQEEQLNEQRCLCDVRPFQAILRLVERKGDKAEKLLNSQIRFLIGKGLNEFDAQKNPEINDFRWKMRLFCEEIARQREDDNLLAKMLTQYPTEVDERPLLPKYLLNKLHEGNIVLSIRMVHNNAESTSRFSFCVPYTINAKELIELVLSKKAHSTGLGMDCSNYLLKICGYDEYLIGHYSLGQYKYIQEMIALEKIPELLLVPANSIELDDEAVYVSLERTEQKRTRSFHDSVAPGRRKQTTISAWTIEEPFAVHINYIHRLNCENNTKVAVEAGLFHGDELLCEHKTTTHKSVEEGECQWEEELKFDLTVCNIPRMARLCFSVYEVSRTVKNNRSRKCQENRQDFYANPIGWVNTTVYDFKHILKTGPVTLHMWPYSQDIDVDVMLTPLGGVVSNPNMDQAAVLTVSFPKYHSFSPIAYPSLEKILECSAAIEAQNNSSIACGTPQASKTYLEQLRLICDRDSLYQLHEQEKELMWFLRQDCCHQLPHSLPKLLRCVKWNDHRDVAQMTSLLRTWPRIPPAKALELLDYAYPDQAVRTFAVQCLKDISDEELSLYLLQLVQALKHESYLQCDLVQFLLRRCLRHRHNGHRFFWLLRSEMKFPAVSIRFGLILEVYCRGATQHMKSLTRQVEALSKLKLANELIQTEGNRRKEGREKLKLLMQELFNQHYYRDMFIGLQNPLDPKCRLGKLRVEKCKFFDSKMKPLYLAFDNIDGYGKDIFIIFKNGDDLRQDMLTLQMIRIMDKMWKDEGLDFRMIPYQCLATDYKVGLIEVVPNADTIANIQKEKGFTATSAFKKGSLLSWLKDHNSDEKSLGKAIEEFTLSCAGYCVATYVLGVADRHSDNIMVKTNGQLFHIDFGHILGKFKEKFGIKRERVPFVLTHDFVYIITKGHTQKSEEFSRFQQYCEQAFTILRKKGPLMISLFAMMLSTGIPELTCEKDLDYLRETLVLGMTEQDALRHFQSKFDEALRNSWKTSVNWLAHNWAKDNKMNA